MLSSPPPVSVMTRHQAHDETAWSIVPGNCLPEPGGSNPHFVSYETTGAPCQGLFVLTDDGCRWFCRRIAERGPYDALNPALEALRRDHPQLKVPGPTSVTFQVWNVVIAHPCIVFDRAVITDVLNALGLESVDPIQLINKIEQYGLASAKLAKGHYSVEWPLRFTDEKLVLRMTGEKPTEERAAKSAQYRARHRRLADTPEGQFQYGHRDPDNPDRGFVMQPSSVNQSYRDRFVMDEFGDPSYPRAAYLADNPEKFYPRENQRAALQRAFYESLSEEAKLEALYNDLCKLSASARHELACRLGEAELHASM